MKRFISIAAIITALLCVSGCGAPTVNTNSTYTNPTVVREPSFEDLAKTVITNTSYISRMKAELSVKLDALSTVELGDAVNLVKDVQSFYGNEHPCDFDGTTYVCRTIPQLAAFESLSQTGYVEGGPIIIIKDATLTKDGKATKVNLVLLGGTEIKEGQATGIKEDVLSGMSLSNEYLYDAYYAIYDNIKDTDTPIVISGYSLGGMVAQQLAGLYYIQNYYNVSNVVAIASPLLAKDSINYDKTTVVRMVDTNDLVPLTSIEENGSYIDPNYCNDLVKSNCAVVKTGNSKTFIGAHVVEYVNPNGVWKNVDILGNENGNATLSFKKENVKAYPANKLNK